tara:strand:- start:1247 stop:2095 length:849 start_codon:yes stop_codon:yes gene_type:complete
MIYAVYRCLYGEDFIQESINSIIDHVDKIFIFFATKPWGYSDSVVYKGETIYFPKKFDNILEKIKELNSSKIHLIEQGQYHQTVPWNQFTNLINNVVIPQYGKPNYFILPDVDHVFTEEQIKLTLCEFKEKQWDVAKVRQIEVWKGFKHRVPDTQERNLLRTGTVLWNMRSLDRLPETKACGEPVYNKELKDRILSSFVFNLGFAVSERTMYWKHLTCMAFSKDVNECLPNENWYEDKWLSWDYWDNNKKLEISIGYEHAIPYVVPYDYDLLPLSIKRKFIE